MIGYFYNQKLLKKSAIAACLSLALSSCAHLQQDDSPEIKMADYAAMTTLDAVKQLEDNFHKSRQNEIERFAPQHFQTAADALNEAQALLKTNEKREKIVQKVAVADAVLKNGSRVAEKIKDILDPELTLEAKLDSLQTPNIYRNDYSSLLERLDAIIRDIESGQIQESQETRKNLLRDMQKLERKAIRYNAMHEPEEILKRVKYRGGEQLAPITYSDALAVFKRAEEFIAQNPNYETGIEQVGMEALFAAKRALYITEAVAALSQKIAISPEQVVLDEEYRLYRVTRELIDEDFRDHPLEVQSEKMAAIARNKAQTFSENEKMVVALKEALIEMKQTSSHQTANSDELKALQAQKNEWLAKEALFKAKVNQLQEELALSQSQLDHTQNRLLDFKLGYDQAQRQMEEEKQKNLALTLELQKQITLPTDAEVNQGPETVAAQPAEPTIDVSDVSTESSQHVVSAESTQAEAPSEMNETATLLVAEPAKSQDSSLESDKLATENIPTNEEQDVPETNNTPLASITSDSEQVEALLTESANDSNENNFAKEESTPGTLSPNESDPQNSQALAEEAAVSSNDTSAQADALESTPVSTSIVIDETEISGSVPPLIAKISDPDAQGPKKVETLEALKSAKNLLHLIQQEEPALNSDIHLSATAKASTGQTSTLSLTQDNLIKERLINKPEAFVNAAE